MGVSVKVIKNIFATQGAQAGNKAGVTANCAALNSQAKSLCPFKYGQLRNSLMYTVDGDEEGFNRDSGEQAPAEQRLNIREAKKEGQVIGYQGTNSDHWYIEFGTRNMAARPFERPAKEIAIDGGKAIAVAARYSKDEMQKAFLKRKQKRLEVG